MSSGPSSAPRGSGSEGQSSTPPSTDTIDAHYRRRQVFGLLLVAAIILAAALYRADPRVLFPPGWWRF